ncbi:MAG: vWA domain-containing protein [Paracoccaceae bacterium]
MRFFASLLIFLTFGLTASAQDRPSTILVLDGSGSMWGQIDGIAKITIAQDVIGKLLTALPGEQQLGLTVYGHRRKGDCSDIETLVMPDIGTRDAIRAAVNAIKPKGKTPMTDAVIAAAQSLRYTEERATVILVSDGIETCHPDPCAAARALEDAGVDFTAHVIGFNIADPKAIAQMQCLADETGGTFLSAENATELAAALEVVAAAPEPEPQPVPVEIRFEATLGKGGPIISSDLVWSFEPVGIAAQTDPTGSTKLELPAGEYAVSVLRLLDESSVDATFSVEDVDKIIKLILPEIVYSASLNAVDTAPVGSVISVTWEAEIGENDFVAIALPDMREGKYAGYEYISAGNPLDLSLPLVPAEYELRYFRNVDGRHELLTTRPLAVTDIVVTLDAAAEIGVGKTLEVVWDGPDYRNDYITIVTADADASVYKNYVSTTQGNPAEVTAPIEPGAYEIRYVANGNPDRVMARRRLEVVKISSSLEAPNEVAAGSPVEVTWDGPDNKNDYISIATRDEKAGKYEGYAYTKYGNPAIVKMPLDAGDYQLRYIANGNPDKILATRAIKVVDVLATLKAASEAISGSILDVGWEGPDNKNDFISVAEMDAKAEKYQNFAYTKHGNPAQVKMPLDPGEYQLRYLANGNPDKVIATRPITVVEANANIDAIEEAVAGSVIDVDWVGPDNKNDYISVAKTDQNPNKYIQYAYTKRDNPAKVTMPLEPGEYQLRYIANGNPDQILATRAIRIVAAEVSLNAAETVEAGRRIDVSWTGPNNKNDYISVTDIGQAAGKYHHYKYTKHGDPALITMPLEPGNYQLRYIANSSPDQILVSRSITVVAANVALDAPDQGVVGTAVDVSYIGPSNKNDYISIAEIGSDPKKYSHYRYTKDHNPVSLNLPEVPGTYLVRYVAAGSPLKVLARRSIEVIKASDAGETAILEAAENAQAGSKLEVFWIGPDGQGDRVIITNIGSEEVLSEVATSAGNPAKLVLPDATGLYMIRYLSGEKNVALGASPITVN